MGFTQNDQGWSRKERTCCSHLPFRLRLTPQAASMELHLVFRQVVLEFS